MEREIKFRVWDGKKIHYNAIVGNGQVLYIPDATGEYKWTNQAEVHPMQYTGLKDDCDIELYEGDIIATITGQMFSIEWNDDTCKFQLSNGSDINDNENYATYKVMVGNICETPELIKNS